MFSSLLRRKKSKKLDFPLSVLFLRMTNYKSLRFAFTLLLVTLLLLNCRSNQSKDNADAITRIVREKIGDEYESIPNPTNEYVLYIKKINDNSERHQNRFIVISLSSATLIEDKLYFPGYVKWKSEYEIEYLNMPGMIREDQDLSAYIKILSVR
jgi:hypothetical protein